MNCIRNYNKKLLLLILIVSLQPLVAQRIKVPIDLQLKVIPKIISLNKNFSFNENAEVINLSVLYSSEQRSSQQVYEEFEKKEKIIGMNIKGKNANVLSIDISSISNLREYLIENKIDVLYITPLRGVDIAKIRSICDEVDVLTISGVAEHIESNVSVVLDLENNKLQITINQKSAKSEGVDFSSRLLKIAKIVE